MKKVKEKYPHNRKYFKEPGRSMVEMLGVLAVIGVLSIGGIVGYRIAMSKYTANEILAELNVRSISYAQRMQALNEIPASVELSDPTGDETKSGYPLQAIGYPDYFEIRIGEVPLRVCQNIQNEIWTRPFEVNVTQEENVCSEIQFKFYNDVEGNAPQAKPDKPTCPAGWVQDANGKCYDRMDKEKCTVKDYCNGHANRTNNNVWFDGNCHCDACDKGWYGNHCELYDPSGDACNGHGAYPWAGGLEGTSGCTCQNGYYGLHCESTDPKDDCNGHGYRSYGTCYCYAGYSGEKCEFGDPYNDPYSISGNIL